MPLFFLFPGRRLDISIICGRVLQAAGCTPEANAKTHYLGGVAANCVDFVAK